MCAGEDDRSSRPPPRRAGRSMPLRVLLPDEYIIIIIITTTTPPLYKHYDYHCLNVVDVVLEAVRVRTDVFSFLIFPLFFFLDFESNKKCVVFSLSQSEGRLTITITNATRLINRRYFYEWPSASRFEKILKHF